MQMIATAPLDEDGSLFDATVDTRPLSLCIGLTCVILVFGGISGRLA